MNYDAQWRILIIICFLRVVDGRVLHKAVCKAGLHDKTKPNDEHVQEKKSHLVIPHPDYKSQSNHDNDIAVLFLEEPFKFTDTVQPVCLPKQGEDIPVEKQCVVTGWGIYRRKFLF